MPDERRPALSGTVYGLNIGRFMDDYGTRWVIMAGPNGEGYTAQRKNGQCHGTGEVFAGLTLDELAGKLAEADAS
jgi:hypothetical protein